MSRVESTFGILVFTQAAHSTEEYVGRLWETFPPARLLTGAISSDREVVFVVINVTLIAFGLWCLVVPIRRAWPSAAAFIWFWIILETVNGVGHPLWTQLQRGYTPGVLTAPLLLVIALYLAFQLRSRPDADAGAA
jgi:hypothetical protein